MPRLQLISMIESSVPDVVGFVTWSGDYELTNQDGAATLLNDAWVVDLSGLPKGI